MNTAPDSPPAPTDPLTGLPLLPDDRRFIRQRLLQASGGRSATLEGYRAHFLEGMKADPDPIKRDNSGRRAANTWLLAVTNRTQDHEQDYF